MITNYITSMVSANLTGFLQVRNASSKKGCSVQPSLIMTGAWDGLGRISGGYPTNITKHAFLEMQNGL